jgi:hypothetical protein
MAYIVLLVHGILAEMGVACDAAIADDDDRNSLYSRNIAVSGLSAMVNLGLHVVIRFFNPDEPGLLDGYWRPGVVLIVFANAFSGTVASRSQGTVEPFPP